MIEYKGKAKCSCGRRAKWKAVNGFGHPLFACHSHKSKLVGLCDPETITDYDDDTEAERIIDSWTR